MEKDAFLDKNWYFHTWLMTVKIIFITLLYVMVKMVTKQFVKRALTNLFYFTLSMSTQLVKASCDKLRGNDIVRE